LICSCSDSGLSSARELCESCDDLCRCTHRFCTRLSLLYRSSSHCCFASESVSPTTPVCVLSCCGCTPSFCQPPIRIPNLLRFPFS
jgi:hypothetical protein